MAICIRIIDAWARAKLCSDNKLKSQPPAPDSGHMPHMSPATTLYSTSTMPVHTLNAKRRSLRDAKHSEAEGREPLRQHVNGCGFPTAGTACKHHAAAKELTIHMNETRRKRANNWPCTYRNTNGVLAAVHSARGVWRDASCTIPGPGRTTHAVQACFTTPDRRRSALRAK